MIELRLKTSSKAMTFDTKNFGIKGRLISIYDEKLQNTKKFVISNIFDLKIKKENNDEIGVKMNISFKLKNTSEKITLQDVFQTDSNEDFYIIRQCENNNVTERYVPLDDIEFIEEKY